MAQLRNFQFLRNGENTISSFANYAAARATAETTFAGISTLQDGEIVLYSYKLDGDATTVHTLLGIKRNGGIEILGNYDELTAEYKSHVASEIAKLDTPEDGVTGSNNGVSVTVTQVDGKIDSVSVVAPSLTSAIEALDVDPFSLTTLNGDKLEGYQISEVDGKIVKGQTAETLLTFASAPTATNKVATQAEISALDAEVTSEDGTNVQVKVTEVDGVITGVNIVKDETVNAGDVRTAITNAINALDNTVVNAEGDIKVTVSQVDGVVTTVAVTDTLADVANSGAAADVTIADTAELFTATNVEAALAEVMTKANELDAAQLEAGTGIDITDNKINANFDIAIETRTEGEGESATTATYIVIKDGETVIAEENANAFVKDSFLQSVTKDAANNTLVFTWNTDAGIEKTTIAISDLCDVYTADETYLHLNGYKFEHIELHTAEKEVGEITFGATDDNSATVEKANDVISFKVPTLTIDKAGHVKELDEYKVNITLPASIGTAIQGGAGVNTTYIQTTVARNATNTNQLDVTATAVIGDYAAEGQVDGLATTKATKTYVDSQIGALQDYNTETTVTTAAKSGIIVTPTITNADAVNEQRTYAISLDTVTRVDNPTAEGAAGTPSTSSFADEATTFTYVKGVNTDANGRVTGIVTETVTENFDAGTY